MPDISAVFVAADHARRVLQYLLTLSNLREKRLDYCGRKTNSVREYQVRTINSTSCPTNITQAQQLHRYLYCSQSYCIETVLFSKPEFSWSSRSTRMASQKDVQDLLRLLTTGRNKMPMMAAMGRIKALQSAGLRR